MKTPEICPSCGALIEGPVTPQEIPVSASIPVDPPPHYNSQNQTPMGSDEIRNPILAASLGFFLSGWGQWYNGKTWSGLKFFVIWVILQFFIIVTGAGGSLHPSLVLLHLLVSLLLFIITIYGMYDAYKTAQKINAGEVPFSGKSRLFWLPVILLILMLVTIFAVSVMAVNANHATETITHDKVVTVTAQKPDPNHIVVTYRGGPSASLLKYIIVTEADNAANRPAQFIGLSNQTTPLAVGSSTTFSGVDSGTDHVVVYGYFNDNTEQTLLETYL
jgi:hypothetical protein